MKKKPVLAFGLILVVLLFLGSGVVWGETTKELPRLTTACETKIGGLLFGVNDSFSSLKSCPKNSRKVILGENQTGNEGNLTVPESGKIAFVNGSMALMKDGTVWMYNVNALVWDRADFNDDGKGDYDITDTGVSYKDIIQWYSGGNLSFLTKNGDYWLYDDAILKWIKATELNH